MLPPTSTLKMQIKYPPETLVHIYERSHIIEGAVKYSKAKFTYNRPRRLRVAVEV
jgi:hypothetical protein